MVKEYRVWNDGSPQGHYIVAESPKLAATYFNKGVAHVYYPTYFNKGVAHVYYPIHVMLWKKGANLWSLQMTKEAKRFMDYRGDDKYTKFGIKYSNRAVNQK